MKTRELVCLKYFFHDCIWKQSFASNLPQAPLNLICLTILVTLSTSTLGQSVCLEYKGDCRCGFKSTGFQCQNRCNKNLESIHQVNKQTLHHQSINQMVIR